MRYHFAVLGAFVAIAISQVACTRNSAGETVRAAPTAHSSLKSWRTLPGWKVTTLKPSIDSGYIHSLVADSDGGVWFAVGHQYLEHISRQGIRHLYELPATASVARICIVKQTVWFAGGQSSAARLGRLSSGSIKLFHIPVLSAQGEFAGPYDVYPDPAGLDASIKGRLWFTEPQGHAIVSYRDGRYTIIPVEAAPGNIAALIGERAVVAAQGGLILIADARGGDERTLLSGVRGEMYLAKDRRGVWIGANGIVAHVSNSLHVRRFDIGALTTIAIAAHADSAFVLAATNEKTPKFFLLQIGRFGDVLKSRIPTMQPILRVTMRRDY